jgi:hypothetical protein
MYAILHAVSASNFPRIEFIYRTEPTICSAPVDNQINDFGHNGPIDLLHVYMGSSIKTH